MKSPKPQNFSGLFSARSLCYALMMVVTLSICINVGCNKSKPAVETDDEEYVFDIPEPLTVMVIGDVELGPRLKRQWSARRDGELTVIDSESAGFLEGGSVVPANVDLIIYPTSMLGELVAQEILSEVPRDVWNSDEVNKNGILKHNRTLTMRHANKNWAIPLGGHNFAMFCHRELFEKAELEPPTTWSKLDRCLTKLQPALSELGDDKLKLKVDMPLADGWAGHTFMARAASMIAHRGKLATVFNRQTMEPLINQAGFVETLESLASIASQRSIDLKPADVYQLACQGDSTIAFTWPAKGFGGEENEENMVPRIASMPGGKMWFDSTRLQWAKRSPEEQFQIDTIGFSGMIASVCIESPNDQTAWDFLTWLSSKSISLVVLTDSPSIGPFRASHLADASLWTGDCVSIDVADEYAEVIEANHNRSQALIFPRVPKHHLYVAALDKAVRDCISGKQSAQDALDAAAGEWKKITESLGRKEQIRNLKLSTGL